MSMVMDFGKPCADQRVVTSPSILDRAWRLVARLLGGRRRPGGRCDIAPVIRAIWLAASRYAPTQNGGESTCRVPGDVALAAVRGAVPVIRRRRSVADGLAAAQKSRRLQRPTRETVPGPGQDGQVGRPVQEPGADAVPECEGDQPGTAGLRTGVEVGTQQARSPEPVAALQSAEAVAPSRAACPGTRARGGRSAGRNSSSSAIPAITRHCPGPRRSCVRSRHAVR